MQLLAQRIRPLNGTRLMTVMKNMPQPSTYQDHLANLHQIPIELQRLRHLKHKRKTASLTQKESHITVTEQ